MTYSSSKKFNANHLLLYEHKKNNNFKAHLIQLGRLFKIKKLSLINRLWSMYSGRATQGVNFVLIIQGFPKFQAR